MGLILGGVSARDLILDGQSVSLYVGGNPPTKVWPTIIKEVVQITLGTGFQASDQFRAALTERGLSYQTITEVPFEIELVGTGSAQNMFFGCSSLTTISPLNTSQVTNMTAMFNGCAALTRVPHMDTSQVTNMLNMFYNCSSLTSVPAMGTSNVTNMSGMFYNCSSLTSVPAMDTSNVTNMSDMFRRCSSLTYVPDMQTSQVTNMTAMFYNCSALTDGNVRLIGRHPNVTTTNMIRDSGLTREPFYKADGTPDDGITIEVHEVSLTDVSGSGTIHPLLTVTVPAGETWAVTIEGTVTRAGSNADLHPFFRIGATTSDGYAQGAAVNFSGTINATDSTIALVTRSSFSSNRASFVGTVTIEK